ncbi:MAG: hypothetical protein HOO19_18135 [Rhodospirillaceae bacterium]|jgi:hypothetical protein|nr:hypothetical protein [Rhodospirillaceae bacterium]MBT3886983.1 hypothetical protein [Rhodospirillaceae bacterium]MBT4118486.1 hypothetical protein [Rhodospirillaceae bacterium]MBT4671075.1 hypothetical protein [Rhodospirillaceae bacterium]MBT4719828.1 hypothetical protein [Rhodospirillaceae bacterium]
MSIFKSLAVAAIAAGALGACQTVVEPNPVCDFTKVQEARDNPSSGPVLVSLVPGAHTDMPLNTVNITDVAVTNKILLQATNAQRTETGNVRVWARMVNCTDFALQLEGRTHFLNAGQAPVEGVTAWKRVFMSPRSIGTFTDLSIAAKDVETYLIEIREGT